MDTRGGARRSPRVAWRPKDGARSAGRITAVEPAGAAAATKLLDGRGEANTRSSYLEKFTATPNMIISPADQRDGE